MRPRPSLGLALLVGLGLLAGACVAQVEDVALKAAYIYNFALFTTWPDGGKGPLYVCASPDSALWGNLQALNGKPVHGRPWTVTDFARPNQKGARCDVAILARTAERPPALGPAVLVVRDGAGHNAAAHGAAITLVDEDEHVRFDIDTQDAARNGLRFSSRLLRLARNVQ